MSYSASPPLPQKQPPRPYPPQHFPSAGSPSNAASPPGYGPPPAKRQRMSPDPRSPPTAGSPNGYGSYSNSAYGNPYAPSPVQTPYSPYVPSPQQSAPPSGFNTPQAYNSYQSQHLPWQSQPPTPSGLRPNQTSPPPQQHQTSGQLMPPPPRPNKEDKDEKVSVDDLGDSLFGSGINLKDEENYLSSVYNNRHASQQGDSFASTQQSVSFGSTTMSPSNSFNLLTQGTSFGSQNGQLGAFAGTLGPIVSEEDVEKELERKRQQAARAKAEREQFHLNNQFLLGNVIRNKLDAKAREQGVRLDVQGLYVKQPSPQAANGTTMVNGEGSEGIVAARGTGEVKKEADSVVDQGAPFGDVVALLSLGAGERLRGLLDEAQTMARARRYGDHGRVPPDFADIAHGNGDKRDETVVPESVTKTQWDKTPEGETPAPQPTISYQGTLSLALRDLAERDHKAEEARQRKRENRQKAVSDSTANGTSDPAVATAGEASTPTGSAEAAPTATEVAPTAPKMSKKEAAKQAKEAGKVAEQMSHMNTNSTAMMAALGGKKKYSWMSGGGGAGTPTNRYAKQGSGSGTATPNPAAAPRIAGGGGGGGGGKGAANGITDPSRDVRGPLWGDFREDGDAGKGLQLRDWVAVLERDGREKAALQRAYLRLQ